MSDNNNYKKYQEEQRKQFEDICAQCGVCCGSHDGDPCALLVYNENTQTYFCNNYEARLGKQKTITGKEFTCVSVHEMIKTDTLRLHCAYRKNLSSSKKIEV